MQLGRFLNKLFNKKEQDRDMLEENYLRQIAGNIGKDWGDDHPGLDCLTLISRPE